MKIWQMLMNNLNPIEIFEQIFEIEISYYTSRCYEVLCYDKLYYIVDIYYIHKSQSLCHAVCIECYDMACFVKDMLNWTVAFVGDRNHSGL